MSYENVNITQYRYGCPADTPAANLNDYYTIAQVIEQTLVQSEFPVTANISINHVSTNHSEQH